MTVEAKRYIFHLRRPGKKALILSPFGKEIALSDNDLPILGLYGSDPELDAVNQFRELLYRQVDSEIRSWLTEMRFIPRFLVAAVVFLATYFILSLAIRDPIPLLVQIVGASAAALGIFVWMGRRDELSSRAVEKRAKVRAVVDGIAFSYSPCLEALEDLVEKYQSHPQLPLSPLLAEIGRTLAAEGLDLGEALRAAILNRYSPATLQKLVHRFKDLPGQLPMEALISWARSFKADVGLLAIYLGSNPSA